ncbi:MAG: nucleotidyltransferase domain-containing protein [Kofleriaceae bacterium]
MGRGLSKKAPNVSMLDALFPRAKQRVLALLFGQPERVFATMELIKLAAIGTGAVQRELDRMTSSGLVTVSLLGGQKRFQANGTSPLFEPLRDIVAKTSGIAEQIRSALAPLASSIRFATLYGSVAKGTDAAMSDVDVLMVANDLALERVYTALQPVEERLSRRVSPTLYTSDEFLRRRRAKQPFLTKVLSGAHVVLLGSEDAVPTR